MEFAADVITAVTEPMLMLWAKSFKITKTMARINHRIVIAEEYKRNFWLLMVVFKRSSKTASEYFLYFDKNNFFI